MLSLKQKKDVGSFVKCFDSPEIMTSLENVRTWLLKNCAMHLQEELPTSKDLSTLAISLIQFQENNSRKNEKTQFPLTRVPIKCFIDFKPDGALCHILASVLKFKQEQGWSLIDFQNPSRMDKNIEMLKNVVNDLLTNEYLVMPRVFIRAHVDEDIKIKVREIIQSHQGFITDTEDEATHIVYPIVDSCDDNYVRPVFQSREGWMMLHRYYTPDSHDSWVKNTEIPIDLPELPPCYNVNAKWKVSASWALDLERYNEWMSEEDYEVDDNGRKKIHKFRLSIEDFIAAAGPERAEKEKNNEEHCCFNSQKDSTIEVFELGRFDSAIPIGFSFNSNKTSTIKEDYSDYRVEEFQLGHYDSAIPIGFSFNSNEPFH